jgi:CRISPR-associated protein Cmr5
MPSLEQERAHYAWEKVRSHADKDYANLAKAAPSLVMGNGLMQTLAFFMSKNKNHHRNLCDDICHWLILRFRIRSEERRDSQNGWFNGTMAFLHTSEPVQYRRATEEAIELLRWIRQFASAVIETGD